MGRWNCAIKLFRRQDKNRFFEIAVLSYLVIFTYEPLSVSPLFVGMRNAMRSVKIIFTIFLVFFCPLSWAENAFQSYELPTAYSLPTKIAVQKTGDIWFIASNLNRIGRYQPAEGVFSEYDIPTLQSMPADIDVSQTGKVWFTEQDSNQLAVFDPASLAFKEYDIPTIGSSPYQIAMDAEGGVWFTEFYGNKIGYFDPAQEVFKEYPVPTPSSRPSGIYVGPYGYVWFMETQGNKLGRLNPKTGSIREYDLPTPFEVPSDIVIDEAGAIWFGARKAHSLMVFYPLKETFDVFPIPNRGVIESLSVGRNRNIFFTFRTSNKIGGFDTAKKEFLEIRVGMGKSRPNGIGVDRSGNIWFADTAKNALFKLDGEAVSKLWLN